MENQQGTGYLKVQTVSAGGAFPVEGAVVIVTDQEGKTAYSLRTDRSGLTDAVSLPAPSVALSQAPPVNGDPAPYSVYTVQVFRDGFYDIEEYSLPIFDGITALWQANLIPKTEFSPLPPNPQPQIGDVPPYTDLQFNGGDTDER